MRDLTREEVVESDEGPDALRKLFPLPGVGGIARTETYRLTEARADLNGDRWNFDARYRRNPTDDHERERDWQFKVTLGVDQEGTGAPTRIPIGELNVAAPASAADVASDRTVTVSVPSGPNEVSFEGVSGPVAELPPGGLRRVRLRMDLKASTRKEAEA